MMIRGDSGYGPSLPELHKRLRWVALAVLAAFALLIGRLWQLQVMRGEGYYERTVSNVVKERYLPSVRGKILDSKGTALADNRPAFNIYATPKTLTSEVKAELERMLGLTDDEIAKIDERLALGRKRDPKSPIMVLEDQGRDRAALVEQAKSRLPGVEVHHEPYRYYPQGDLAAHLIGYMTQMTADEADKLTAQGYAPSDLIGRYGLESGERGDELEDGAGRVGRAQRLVDERLARVVHEQRVFRVREVARHRVRIERRLGHDGFHAARLRFDHDDRARGDTRDGLLGEALELAVDREDQVCARDGIDDALALDEGGDRLVVEALALRVDGVVLDAALAA